MTRFSLVGFGAAVVLTAALAGCGSGASSSSSTSSDGVAGTTVAGTVDATVQETVNGTFTFSPQTVTIPVGGVVKWVDQGSVPHNVTFSGGASSLSSSTGTGDWEVKFTKAGKYPYICTIHPGMVGTIVVS